MNDLDPLIRGCIKVTSTIALHLTWISRKPLYRNTNRKWHRGYQVVTWPMTLTSR